MEETSQRRDGKSGGIIKEETVEGNGKWLGAIMREEDMQEEEEESRNKKTI